MTFCLRVFGDTAVVTSSDDEKSSYKGKDTSGHWTWTDVLVKRQGAGRRRLRKALA